MRLLALPFPKSYGGDGFDFVTTVAAYHALGYGCKDFGLILALASQIICGLTIQLFGNEEQVMSLLPDLASGKLIYCQGITEPSPAQMPLRCGPWQLKKITDISSMVPRR